MTEGIRLALRVDDLDPEHQPPTADIAQLRIVALEDAQVLGQALAHGRRARRSNRSPEPERRAARSPRWPAAAW